MDTADIASVSSPITGLSTTNVSSFPSEMMIVTKTPISANDKQVTLPKDRSLLAIRRNHKPKSIKPEGRTDGGSTTDDMKQKISPGELVKKNA